MATTTEIAAKQVRLGQTTGARYASHFLVIGFDGSTFRLAYYRIRNPKDDGRLSLNAPNEQAWQHGVDAGWLPPDGRREAWVREAFAGSELGNALRVVLEGSPHRWQVVEDYVRSTAWGAELP